MRLCDIMVVLGGTDRDDAVLDLALGIASQNDAHVTGLCPLELLYPGDLSGAIGGYPQLLMLRDVAGRLDARVHEQAQVIEKAFLAKLAEKRARGAWRAVDGAAMDVIVMHGRTADLVVLGQAMPEETLTIPVAALIRETLLRLGRPLLVVPYAGRFEAVGRNVLIGWKGTREGARAAHDALMLMEPAATVTVLTVEKARAVEQETEKPGAAMAEHLTRHGLEATAARTISDHSITDADALLNYASDVGADLLVIGGYGHSRVRELVFGGVSDALLDHTTLPVLMSH